MFRAPLPPPCQLRLCVTFVYLVISDLHIFLYNLFCVPLCLITSRSPLLPPVLLLQQFFVCFHLQGSAPAPLSSEPLDHRQIFAVVNAWRTVQPGGRARVLLAFQPQQRTAYLQMLTIR
jgi:hypothetical protein